MKKTVSYWLISFALIISVVFLAIEIWAFNPSFYRYEFKNNKIADELNIEDSELDNANANLLNYIRGIDEKLDYQIIIDGKNEQFFNQKDILHMEDVRQLYLNFKIVGYMAILISVIAIIYNLFNHQNIIEFYYSFKRVLLLIGAAVFACLFMMTIDFESFWYNIHFLFFDNLLWIISPLESRLIIMMNQNLFNDLVLLIVFSIIILLSVLFYILRFIVKRKENIL